MATYARESLGDLVVATTELVEANGQPDERWLWLAVETGIAARAAPEEVADHLAMLAPLLWSTYFGVAVEERAQRGRLPWRERCLYRSALELLRDMYPERDIDTSGLELAMIASNYVPVTPPAGIPEHHWWWRARVPPGELRVNPQMEELLALGAIQVPRDFRREIAAGFVEAGGGIYLRTNVPQDDLDAAGQEEWVFNERELEAYLPRDDSRRPVDMASTALACARWLAAELRRAAPYACQIIAVLHRGSMSGTIRFVRRRDLLRADPPERGGPTLVLESRDL